MISETAFSAQIEERFWAKVKITGPDDCWLWTGCINKEDGYGQVGIGGKKLKAHRVSWVIAHGEIPKGVDVLHICDNPPCMNPHHLFLGTHTDNMLDMVNKGRHSGGNKILTDAMVVGMRELYSGGTNMCQLAKMYGVHRQTIWRAIHGITWKHVGGIPCEF